MNKISGVTVLKIVGFGLMIAAQAVTGIAGTKEMKQVVEEMVKKHHV